MANGYDHLIMIEMQKLWIWPTISINNKRTPLAIVPCNERTDWSLFSHNQKWLWLIFEIELLIVERLVKSTGPQLAPARARYLKNQNT